jgi:Tol biopolymer transport system component
MGTATVTASVSGGKNPTGSTTVALMDSGKIAYVSTPAGSGEIYVMDPDGTDSVRLTTSAAGVGNQLPSWSPDGSRIAFTSWRDGNVEIYAMNGDGTDVSRLTTDGSVDSYPSWSPDGSRIIWAPAQNVRTGFGDLRRMRADGSAATRITTTKRIDEYEPDWIVLP